MSRPGHPSARGRPLALAGAVALLAGLAPAWAPAVPRRVIQPIPPVKQFSQAELRSLHEQWAGKVYDFAPPRGGIRALRQPDGSTFDAVLTGAEVGARFEALSGHTVVKNRAGWWTYAVKGRSRPGEVVAGDRIVGRDAPTGIPPHVGRTAPIWIDPRTGRDIREPLFERFRAVSVAATQRAQATGQARRYKIPAILLETKGEFQPGSSPEATQHFLSGFGTNDTGTVTEFYMEMSYGQMLAEVDVYGPYKSIPSQLDPCHYGGITVAGQSHYASPLNQLTNGFVVGVGGGGVLGMALEAIPQADPDIDFSQYDNDGDGYVDLVFIVHSGPDMAVTGDPCDTWSHAISLEPTLEPLTPPASPLKAGIPTADGVVVANLNTVPELGVPEGMDVGVVSHEMSHNLGEPDFYDTSYKSNGTGDWDNMAGGSHFGDPPGSNPLHFNPLVKMAQAWIEPRVISGTTRNIQLRPWEVYPDLLMVPLRRGDDPTTEEVERDAVLEAHLIHFSSRSAHGPRRWGSPIDGPDEPALFDRMLLNSGLLVWHWDDTISNNNDSSRYRLDLEEFDHLDTTQELALNLTRGEPTDPYVDTATGLSGATRVVSGGTPSAPIRFEGTALPSATLAMPPFAYTFEFTVPNNPANRTMTVRETCASEGGDWDLYVDEFIGGEWVEVASGATGACSESAGLARPTLGGRYRVRVANFLAPDVAGGFTGEISFGRGEVYLRPDTYDNEGNPTGWTIGNVRPRAEGMQLSAEVRAPSFMMLDVLRDARADVSPGFLRAAEAVLAGRTATLSFEVFNNGATEARNVVVTVLEGDRTVAMRTLPSLGPSSSAALSIPWTPTGEGRHVLTVRVRTDSVEASADNNAQVTALMAYSPSALGSVLIVDDDDGYESEQTYEGALGALGIPYAVTHAHPSGEELRRYRAVIWEAGVARMEGQLSRGDLAVLRDYLEHGGRVWFSSPRLVAGLTAQDDTVTGSINPGVDPTFGANYLGIGYHDSASRGGGMAVPTKAGVVSVAFAFKPFPGRPIQDVPKAVPSKFGIVTPILDWARPGKDAVPLGTLVRGNARHGGFVTVFTGLNAATIVTPEAQVTLVRDVMRVLGVPARPYVPRAPMVRHTPPVYALRGEPQVLTAYVRGAEVRRVLLDYRRLGAVTVTTVPMIERAEGVFEATLDGRLVQPPGFEYRIVAETDAGRQTAPPARDFGYFVSVARGAATPRLPYSITQVLGARFVPAGLAPHAAVARPPGGRALPATGAGLGLIGLVPLAVAALGLVALRRRA